MTNSDTIREFLKYASSRLDYIEKSANKAKDIQLIGSMFKQLGLLAQQAGGPKRKRLDAINRLKGFARNGEPGVAARAKQILEQNFKVNVNGFPLYKTQGKGRENLKKLTNRDAQLQPKQNIWGQIEDSFSGNNVVNVRRRGKTRAYRITGSDPIELSYGKAPEGVVRDPSNQATAGVGAKPFELTYGAPEFISENSKPIELASNNGELFNSTGINSGTVSAEFNGIRNADALGGNASIPISMTGNKDIAPSINDTVKKYLNQANEGIKANPLAFGGLTAGGAGIAGGVGGYAGGKTSGRQEGADAAAAYYKMREFLTQQQLRNANDSFLSRLANVFGGGQVSNLIG